MLRFSRIRLTLALLAVLLPAWMAAQDSASSDPNDVPLGDVARNMRKKTPPSQDVIDDDNLPQVMQQAEKLHPPGSALKFLMAGESKLFQISAPDVTCSLAFNANAKSLLSSQYSQMDLPPADMLRLEGPAAIEGDALTVSVFNATDWHVSELAVAVTVVRKAQPQDASLIDGEDAAAAAVAGNLAQSSDARPEKKPDVTLIYRMRAAAVPFARTVFRAPLNLELAPGDEWHWAIVQAKGYPPQSYVPSTPQTTAQTSEPILPKPTVPASLWVPQDSAEASLPQGPQ
jgi:hypothetical protein